MNVSLQDWLKFGWLREHRTNSQEIAELLAAADRDLQDCQTPGLSPDWRVSIAYNSALLSATAALAAAGFRSGRGESHHHRVIQSLAYTLGAAPFLIAHFDAFRKKRNITGYERAGAVSDQEAQEMLDLAKRLRADVQAWLRANHPSLVSG